MKQWRCGQQRQTVPSDRTPGTGYCMLSEPIVSSRNLPDSVRNDMGFQRWQVFATEQTTMAGTFYLDLNRFWIRWRDRAGRKDSADVKRWNAEKDEETVFKTFCGEQAVWHRAGTNGQRPALLPPFALCSHYIGGQGFTPLKGWHSGNTVVLEEATIWYISRKA